MPIDKSKITKDMLEKAMKCKTPEELIALAKTEGFDITKEEAEAYLAELADFEMDGEQLQKVAGGRCYLDGCPDYVPCGSYDCVYYTQV